MNHALMLFSKFLERLTYFFFWSRFDTNFSTFPIFILSAKTDSSLWFLWSFKGYSTFTSKTYPSFVFVCFNQTRVLVVFGSLLNHKGSLRPIAGIVLLFHRLIVSPDSAFSCRVCVCVCVCACVCVFYVHWPWRLHLSGSVWTPGNRSTMLCRKRKFPMPSPFIATLECST